ncbi:hypothetical protein D9758_004211 [Tetrapyrgos nigripes]|uniref:RRM domain-containing protein n=1 Tax=Tetrapyrgos nigripes TaxID=182062 RepID=A0A8H5LVQ3_9AGAR|nr:hypothetical protein D9758_004211 [Tetrapyrgos nigripes]
MSHTGEIEYPPGLSMRLGQGGNDGTGALTGLSNRTTLNRGAGPFVPSSEARRSSAASLSGYSASWEQSSSLGEGANKRDAGGSGECGATHFGHHPSFTNHYQRPSPPPPLPLSPGIDRDAQRYLLSPTSVSPSTPNPTNNSSATSDTTRSTLWWGELEPWMDEEYGKQVCALMGWEPVNIKVPQPSQDSTTGRQANNPGYCYLTFPSPAHAAAALAQVSNPNTGFPTTMPNSSKSFTLNWASNVSLPGTTPLPSSNPLVPNRANLNDFNNLLQQQQGQPQYPKEYSIFVGDLAPETSNSDLVAVFRNPVLGLRNDREPKFIRPFLSCKSAKIMLDPATGVSRGYGFVRFTDEADQQRALIEMHGLYCLSRPMRISPATAKFKPLAPLEQQLDQQLNVTLNNPAQAQVFSQLAQAALPLGSSVGQPKSVSAPIAAGNSNGSTSSPSSIATSSSANSNGSLASTATAYSSSASAEELMNQLGYGTSGANGVDTSNATKNASSITSSFTADTGSRYLINEESWKHHAQARAILGNLIGPNGEQLTSTDPYNTTVFVGGLSPLISEETLRTFFAPFGDIHYVKVPVGKHCGFVQFVRKADAEMAIEKMQGFPIGGSRIRLSWGRSQYKAAQAAAQAAQAAALQSQFPASLQSSVSQLTQEQTIQLFQKLTSQGYLNPPSSMSSAPDNFLRSVSQYDGSGVDVLQNRAMPSLYADDKLRAAQLSSREDVLPGYNTAFQNNYNLFAATQDIKQASSFSPFSPDPSSLYNTLSSLNAGSAPHDPVSHSIPSPLSMEAILKDRRDSYSTRSPVNVDGKSFQSLGSFSSTSSEDNGRNMNGIGSGMDKLSSTSARPPSASRYQAFHSASPIGPGSLTNGREGSPPNLSVGNGRVPVPISRPSSGQTSLMSIGNGVASPFGTRNFGPTRGYDTMQDLNGTLARLDLNEREKYSRPWGTKSPTASSESSGVSVQFQLTKDDTPSGSVRDEHRGSQ